MKFKLEQTEQKLRGGYYTPQKLADYITKWVLNKQPNSILEPSCGDGVFIQSLGNNNLKKHVKISCFEIIDTESKKTLKRSKDLGFKNVNIITGDFLKFANNELKKEKKLFDAVVGNPPFIRYQFLEKPFQEQTEMVFKTLDLKFTKHTNAWVPFILSSLALLKDGGRMGMIIPSEIIHIMHAQSLRTYMTNMCSKIVIIDPKEIWFENTLQGAVIIFAEKKENAKKPTEGISIISVDGFDFIKESPEDLFKNASVINNESIKGKWTRAFLKKNELDLIEKILCHKLVYKFKDIAKVNVGIVTGANDFFLVDNKTVSKYDLTEYAYPIFGKSNHCPGILYDELQHNYNQSQNMSTNLLYITEEFNKLPRKVKKYIKIGEEKKYQERYKCRIRKPWYKVPSFYNTEIGMPKFCHNFPRLVLNQVRAYTTDSLYRITSTFTDSENLVCSFLNPLTAIIAELEGRYYGGGVLEIVPSEIEELYVPILNENKSDINLLNKLVKDGEIDKLMQIQGEIIFSNLGFTSEEINQLITIWKKLRDHRQRK